LILSCDIHNKYLSEMTGCFCF